MLFSKIILENYGIYKDRQIFDFTSSSEKPIILCGGTNGAGKTTLFNSVMLCLYGQDSFEKRTTRKDYDEFLRRKIHRYLGSKTFADFAAITVEFQYYHQGKVENYSVTRLWKNDDGKIIENLSIKKNGEKLDSVDESQWHQFIRELLPRGIARLFFFDGEKIVKIAKEGGEDIEIKSSFDMLLGLDMVEQLKSDLEINLMRNMKGGTKEIQEKKDELDSELVELQKTVTDLKIKRERKLDVLNEIQKTVDDYEAKISRLGGGYATQRHELQKNESVLEERTSSLEEKIREICLDALPFSMIPRQLEQLVAQINQDQEITKNHLEKQILEENLSQVSKKINEDKFWNDFKVDSNLKKEISSKIENLFQAKIPSMSETQTPVIDLSPNETVKILDTVKKADVVMLSKLEKYTVEYNKITEELQKTKTALSNAPTDDEIGPLITKLNSEHEKMGVIKTEIDYSDQKIHEQTSLIGLKKLALRQLVDEKYKQKASETNLQITRDVQKVLGLYSEKLREKKLHLLEKYLIEAIQVLIHKENFIEKVAIDKKTFAITLYRKNNQEMFKDELSEGEKQMFATAVLWALAKTSGRPLPFMIDTPLARLDVEHRGKLVETFFPSASHQVVIFSTDAEIDEKYYAQLKPFISKSYLMKYSSDSGSAKVEEGFFWEQKVTN
jgi:DNA sulfur modification protein DndD